MDSQTIFTVKYELRNGLYYLSEYYFNSSFLNLNGSDKKIKKNIK